jgi:hypothetical protein
MSRDLKIRRSRAVVHQLRENDATTGLHGRASQPTAAAGDRRVRPPLRPEGQAPLAASRGRSGGEGRSVSIESALRFVRRLLAFRRAYPTLCLSQFWRDGVRWYGVGPSTDLGDDSHSLAFALRGGSEGDCDLYVMINAYHEPLTFAIQEGRPGCWRRAIDTGLPGPDDIAHPDLGPPLPSQEYLVQSRSLVALAGEHDARPSRPWTRCREPS